MFGSLCKFYICVLSFFSSLIHESVGQNEFAASFNTEYSQGLTFASSSNDNVAKLIACPGSSLSGNCTTYLGDQISNDTLFSNNEFRSSELCFGKISFYMEASLKGKKLFYTAPISCRLIEIPKHFQNAQSFEFGPVFTFTEHTSSSLIFCEHEYLGNECLSYENEQKFLKDLRFIKEGQWNDRLQSLKICNGHVIFFDRTNYAGRSYQISAINECKTVDKLAKLGRGGLNNWKRDISSFQFTPIYSPSLEYDLKLCIHPFGHSANRCHDFKIVEDQAQKLDVPDEFLNHITSLVVCNAKIDFYSGLNSTGNTFSMDSGDDSCATLLNLAETKFRGFDNRISSFEVFPYLDKASGCSAGNPCDVNAECKSDTNGAVQCLCKFPFVGHGENCQLKKTRSLPENLALRRGDRLISESNRYSAIFWEGCLTIFDQSDRVPRKPVWTQSCLDDKGQYIHLSTAGSLISYDSGDNEISRTETISNATTSQQGHQLVMLNDRNLVVVDDSLNVVWESNTSIMEVDSGSFQFPSGFLLAAGDQQIISSNGRYRAGLDNSGFFSLTKSNNGNSYWNTNTSGETASINETGNLCIYVNTTIAVWCSDNLNSGSGPFHGVIHNDGAFAIYNNNYDIIWETQTHFEKDEEDKISEEEAYAAAFSSILPNYLSADAEFILRDNKEKKGNFFNDGHYICLATQWNQIQQSFVKTDYCDGERHQRFYLRPKSVSVYHKQESYRAMCLFSEINYQGQTKCFILENYQPSLSGEFLLENLNLASSIKVIGVHAFVFEEKNFKGDSAVIDNDIPDLSVIKFNDRISSFKMVKGLRIVTDEEIDYQVKNEHGLCLTAPQRNIAGSKLQFVTCNNTLDEQWFFNSISGSFSNRNGKCISLLLDSDSNHITMAHCHPTDKRQQWDFTDLHRIKHYYSNLCLDSDLLMVMCDSAPAWDLGDFVTLVYYDFDWFRQCPYGTRSSPDGVCNGKATLPVWVPPQMQIGDEIKMEIIPIDHSNACVQKQSSKEDITVELCEGSMPWIYEYTQAPQLGFKYGRFIHIETNKALTPTTPQRTPRKELRYELSPKYDSNAPNMGIQEFTPIRCDNGECRNNKALLYPGKPGWAKWLSMALSFVPFFSFVSLIGHTLDCALDSRSSACDDIVGDIIDVVVDIIPVSAVFAIGGVASKTAVRGAIKLAKKTFKETGMTAVKVLDDVLSNSLRFVSRHTDKVKIIGQNAKRQYETTYNFVDNLVDFVDPTTGDFISDSGHALRQIEAFNFCGTAGNRGQCQKLINVNSNLNSNSSLSLLESSFGFLYLVPVVTLLFLLITSEW